MTREEFNNKWMPLADGFYKVAYYLLESEAEAQDVVQEVFIRLWTDRGKLEHVLNPKAYGTMIIRNSCIDIIRKNTKVRKEELSETIAAPPEDDGSPREKLKAASAAIRELPEIQQQIITMRAYRKMEFEEIAKELGISQVNVRVQLSRARKRLKELMETNYYETN